MGESRGSKTQKEQQTGTGQNAARSVIAPAAHSWAGASGRAQEAYSRDLAATKSESVRTFVELWEAQRKREDAWGDAIARRRKAAGKTQAELAEAAGIQYKTLKEIEQPWRSETHQYELKANQARTISDALGVATLSQLLGEITDEEADALAAYRALDRQDRDLAMGLMKRLGARPNIRDCSDTEHS